RRRGDADQAARGRRDRAGEGPPSASGEDLGAAKESGDRQGATGKDAGADRVGPGVHYEPHHAHLQEPARGPPVEPGQRRATLPGDGPTRAGLRQSDRRCQGEDENRRGEAAEQADDAHQSAQYGPQAWRLLDGGAAGRRRGAEARSVAPAQDHPEAPQDVAATELPGRQPAGRSGPQEVRLPAVLEETRGSARHRGDELAEHGERERGGSRGAAHRPAESALDTAGARSLYRTRARRGDGGGGRVPQSTTALRAGGRALSRVAGARRHSGPGPRAELRARMTRGRPR